MNTITLIRLFFITFVFSVACHVNSSGSIVVLNGLTHENTVQPGESYRGTIQIQNIGTSQRNVRVYQRDYWFSYTGESKHDPAGTLDRSNAGWIIFNPELLSLEPNETATITFEVNIPANADLAGSYWSVLMVEGITTPDTTNTSSGVTINTAIRYAVQVITNIGNTGVRDIDFLGLDLATENQNNFLNVFIENTGERLLRPELALELFDEQGNSAGIIKAERRKTYPGTSVSISLDLEGIVPGKYTGVLVADCDEDHVFGTNVSFELL